MKASHRLLILSPAFHDYDVAFAAAFEELGFQTHTHLYDRFASLSQKVKNKVRFELPERLGRDTTQRREEYANAGILTTLREVKPDLVLVIKGDVLHPDVWQELETRKIPVVLWLWDEVRRTRWKPERLREIPQVASYSALDVEAFRESGISATYVPMGFDHLLEFPTLPFAPEITHIGARYPKRQAMIEGLYGRGFRVKTYGRDWSHDVRDRLRTWGGDRPDVPSGRDLDRAHAYATMRDSLATLNIHGDQDGFTMRTFEAAGAGAVQLCDRADVAEAYEPGREILTFSSVDEAREHISKIQADPRWADSVRTEARRRTLAEHTLVHRARAIQELW
ncbi:CgeB family protein [Kocuria massiliensis]|uniref:CgeB family protein n=1 Tax=Kocuria massiliensis TaxID=1926282 RepID=UPI000A1CBFC1|nr:glycosyltransferase [Kocuria massiliensis]